MAFAQKIKGYVIFQPQSFPVQNCWKRCRDSPSARFKNDSPARHNKGNLVRFTSA
jgi:hypothetical protein